MLNQTWRVAVAVAVLLAAELLEAITQEVLAEMVALEQLHQLLEHL
jgi:hypothetical protein